VANKFDNPASDDVFEISLLDTSPSEKSGQTVTLRKEGALWKIARLMAWVAD
jgi:hypothetical protein